MSRTKKTPPRARVGRPATTPDATFRIQIAAYADALPRGNKDAAAICGVTVRTIQLWRSGKGSPNRSTRMGALGLLAMNMTKETPA